MTGDGFPYYGDSVGSGNSWSNALGNGEDHGGSRGNGFGDGYGDANGDSRHWGEDDLPLVPIIYDLRAMLIQARVEL